MSSKTEIKALETMAGSHGSDIITGTDTFYPPLGYVIQAFIASEDTVVDTADEIVNGYIRKASGLSSSTVKAGGTILLPAHKPMVSLKLTSGSGVVYFSKLEGLPKSSNVATVAGLTTGAILFSSRHIKVTSPSADSVCCLPAMGATTVGWTLNGWVGANGFELRPIAAQAGTVYINGVTTNVEAAIPAHSEFLVECIDATHVILKVWDANGNLRATIVPDAI
jgi:hypothetical protein